MLLSGGWVNVEGGAGGNDNLPQAAVRAAVRARGVSVVCSAVHPLRVHCGLSGCTAVRRSSSLAVRLLGLSMRVLRRGPIGPSVLQDPASCDF